MHQADPCAALRRKRLGPRGEVATDLTLPIRTRTQTVLTRDDYDRLLEDCASLYRTRPGLANATYFEHLRALEPGEGLRLATADKFHHFALMASDLVMFGRVRRLVRAKNELHPAKHHSFEVRTMPVDDWITFPDRSMHDFLDFVFGSIMPEGRNTQLAARYKVRSRPFWRGFCCCDTCRATLDPMPWRVFSLSERSGVTGSRQQLTKH